MILRSLSIVIGASLLSSAAWAQAPSPAQMGITTATPNVVQVLDSSQTWATIGTVDPVTHLFTVSLPPLVTSFNTRTGAVTLSSGDVTGALGFTPYNATNPSNYVNAAGAAAAAPVQSVAGRTGAVMLTHSDITDWATSLTPYALLVSPAFSGAPTAPTPSPGDSSTKLATTAFVGTAVTAGAYTLPTASTSILGGVKVDGSTISINGSGVISGTPPAITANSTPTSGFAVGQLMISDATKTQAVGSGTVISLGNMTWPLYMYGNSTAPDHPNITFTNNLANASAWGVGVILQGGSIGVGMDIPGPAAVNGFYGFSNGAGYNDISPDAAFASDGYGIASFRNVYSPTTPESLRVYNTHTDINNGEWGGLDWQTTPNVLTISTGANGTGFGRPIKIAAADGAIDYGVSFGGFWTVYAYYGLTPPNSGSTYLGFTNRHWYTVYTDGITIGPSELPGVTCAAGQASVSTLGVITTCAAPTFPQTVAGTVTSGGIPYFSSVTAMSSSAVLTNNAVMIGKGAGAAPTTTTTPTASAFISNGTKPTLTTGTCSGSSGAGGATAGTFVLVGICAAAGTVILTAMPAATTGYACDMEDRVTRAATIVQSAATTTSATFIMGGTPSVANDVFQWKCMGY